MVESYVPSRVKVTTGAVYDRFLTLMPLVLLVATIFGFVSYRELVFLSMVTLETDVPCNSETVTMSVFTCPVTRSITTILGGSK